MRLTRPRPPGVVAPVTPPILARLRRLRSSGFVYGELDPNGWYPVERQNPRTLWLLTPHGVVEVTRQDVDVAEAPTTPIRTGE